ncbi:MAG: hypothetical protein IKB38_01880 [Clostridia bacterium]|nr:hypothetical protein [Clostridia bacterium]
MRLCSEIIEYEKLKDINTEVLFKVASARAAGISVVRFDIKSEDRQRAGRICGFLSRVLRSMKKRGAIQFFVTKDGLARSTTEAQYILNVFPEVAASIPTDDGCEFIFVRI